jgi:phage-related baseplate assembly protein
MVGHPEMRERGAEEPVALAYDETHHGDPTSTGPASTCTCWTSDVDADASRPHHAQAEEDSASRSRVARAPPAWPCAGTTLAHSSCWSCCEAAQPSRLRSPRSGEAVFDVLPFDRCLGMRSPFARAQIAFFTNCSILGLNTR